MESIKEDHASRARSDSVLPMRGILDNLWVDETVKAHAVAVAKPPTHDVERQCLWIPTPHHQRDNLLLRLPAELRNRIYELVLGGRIYRFKDTVCTNHARLKTKERHIFGLLYVCRQIYFETALLPYTMNMFSFRDFDISLYPFLKERSPAQFRSIHSLELVTYQAGQMWAESELFSENFTEEVRVLARLPGLRHIRIMIDTMESLYRGWRPDDLNFEYVSNNKKMLESVIHDHRPDVVVTFWWI